MSKYPEPTTGAFIRNKKGALLLVKSPKWGNYWTVPGGHIEIGETIEESVIREVKEEVGIKVKLLRVFSTLEAIFSKQFHKRKHFIFLQCECLMEKDQPIKLDGREIINYKWFPLESAKKLKNVNEFSKKSIKLLS